MNKLIKNQNGWTEELKEQVDNFRAAMGDLADEDLTILISLINWAREEATIDKCEACDKISSDEAFDYVSENYEPQHNEGYD